MMKNILVTLDIDENIQLLIDKAIELAQSENSKIWLMHIAAPDSDFVSYKVGPQYIRDGIAEDLRVEHRLLQSHALKLQEKGFIAEGLLVQGATIEMIINESEKLNIDLIITGSHDHSFLYKAFIGSVSSQIINKSKIPVLLVPL